MNCVIIHKLRNRVNVMVKQDVPADKGQGQSQIKGSKLKPQDKQTYMILLLVTFGFLILNTPAYLFFLFVMIVDFTKSPLLFVGYYLLYHIAQKLNYTNHGINFFFYVISGTKFRSDFLRLFRIENQDTQECVTSQSTDTNTQ